MVSQAAQVFKLVVLFLRDGLEVAGCSVVIRRGEIVEVSHDCPRQVCTVYKTGFTVNIYFI